MSSPLSFEHLADIRDGARRMAERTRAGRRRPQPTRRNGRPSKASSHRVGGGTHQGRYECGWAEPPVFVSASSMLRQPFERA